jgi:hypothetical protein
LGAETRSELLTLVTLAPSESRGASSSSVVADWSHVVAAVLYMIVLAGGIWLVYGASTAGNAW